MNTEKTSIIAIRDESKSLVGIVYKDEATRHNLFFRCEVMDFEEIDTFLKGIVPISPGKIVMLTKEESKRLQVGETLEQIVASRK